MKSSSIAYFGAVALGAASVIAASGVENSTSFGGILGYTFFSVLIGAAAVALLGLGNWMEQEEKDSRERLRKAHRIHARNPEYPYKDHTEKGA